MNEEVKDRVFSGADKNYVIAVPAEGALVVHLKCTDTSPREASGAEFVLTTSTD